MDLDLKSLSLTLAAGLVAVSAWFIALRVTWPEIAGSMRIYLFKSDHSPRWATAIAGGVIIVGVGILAEEMSRNALAGRSPAAMGAQLGAVLPTESYQRALALLQPLGQKRLLALRKATSADFTDLRTCRRARTKQELDRRVLAALHPIGRETFAAICARAKENRLLPAEALYFQRLIESESGPVPLGRLVFHSGISEIKPLSELQSANEVGRVPALCQAVAEQDLVLELSCDDVVNGIPSLYYVAKHVAYLMENPYDELERFRSREDLARAAFFGIFSAVYGLMALYCARSAWEMTRDYGCAKHIFGWVLLSLVAVFLADALGPMPFVYGDSSVLTDWAVAQFADDHQTYESLTRVAQVLRVISLPAAFAWVWMYNMRRIVRRRSIALFERIGRRELVARRTAVALALMLIALMPIGGAYQSSQVNFVFRVMAYYSHARGETLQCSPTRSECVTKGNRGNGAE